MADDIEDFKAKYMRRLDKELGGAPSDISEVSTADYEQFKQEYMPKHLSFYEKACQLAGKILRVGPDEKTKKEMKKAINITHLEMTPTDAMSFAILAPLLFILIASTIGYILPAFLAPGQSGGSLFMALFAIITGLVMIYPLQRMPFFLSNRWRMKASNQMVLCVFYIVTFMRHTSNLELAVDFAADHLTPPLSMDLKKVVWDIETGKHESLKESMDSYLQTWKDWNKEFIESMHLIESSLYETDESRRIEALEKALDVMLNETYEKMLHYAHNLKSPLQALHMLGIVLPILGLVILPLVVSFIPEVHWYHVMVLYNVALPIGVFYMGKNIMSKRPTGYGETKMTKGNNRMKKFEKINFNILGEEMSMSPLWIGGTILILFLLVGFTPLILHTLNPNFDYALTDSGIQAISGYQSEDAMFYFLGYRPLIQDGSAVEGVFLGPFGLGATLLSLLVPLAFGVGIGIYYKLRTKDLMKVRRKSKDLEEEFASALFQLGNRLGDGLPAEIAFEKVANTMEDSISGKFFKLVSINISRLGMGLEKAIFDPDKGALSYYPSNLIESSMKVLVQASKKGPMVASQALMNVSEYIKQMHRVDERLKDLMADIVSDMKSQISFLTPAIAGIVVGITSMITKILGNLGENLTRLQTQAATSQGVPAGGLLNLFGTGMPTFWFQIIVGLYVVQVVYILTTLVNGIENGSDDLMEKNSLGKYLMRTTITYCIIAGVVMLLFNIIAGTIVTPIAAGAGG